MTTQTETAAYSPAARKIAAIIAALAFAALAVQPALGEFSYAENLARMLRFFTIWGNIAACALLAAIALGRTPSGGSMAALATMMTVIGSIYWILLSSTHHPVGFDRVTNQFHHTIIPVASVAFWLRFTPQEASTLGLLPSIMVPPLTYGAFALILGQVTGFYAYFFVDLPQLGWPQFLINNAGLAVFFAGLGAVMVTIKNALARLTSGPSQPASLP